MSKRVEKHSGQSGAEKHGRTYVDPEYRRRRREMIKAEEEHFEAMCGPVEIRKIDVADRRDRPEH